MACGWWPVALRDNRYGHFVHELVAPVDVTSGSHELMISEQEVPSRPKVGMLISDIAAVPVRPFA
ncbi:protein of unknown function [Candidatus Methylomirabilis oxygeniifera]|uniref:Uncharacterized protein n=1 Tax=Methylomirabilis oxygeniifera TaxID=671143 RepID=D5MHL1_METO1|nr:protein of unknown function [Candidatus Methylomirabilis oxyfera]